MRYVLALGGLLATGLTLLAVAGAGTTDGARATAVTVASGDLQAGLAAYGALPLSFVPTAGQLDRSVRYSAQAAGASFFFARKEVAFSFAQNRKPSLALRLRFVGANPDPVVAGQERQLGRINYLRGTDSSKWRTNVPTYGEVVYHDLWPGIDLVFRGARGQLKYELHVAPGANVDRIRLAYSGARGLSLDRSGNLRIKTSLGTIRDSQPVSYQQLDGRRVPVTSRFLLAPAAGGYGFAVEGYDRRRPLVIDPGLAYSTYLGTPTQDGSSGFGIAVDGAGSAYVTGTAEEGFPITAGAVDGSAAPGAGGDAFVTKLNAAGSALVYSTYLGGNDIDTGSRIAVDRAGSAYVSGLTDSADFPTTAGAFDRSYNGDREVFVTKLNAAGSALVYSTYVGGKRFDVSGDLAVDGTGSAYVSGVTNSENFPTTEGAFDRSYNGGVQDTFVIKLNAAGSTLHYSTYLGGKGDDHSRGIAVDGTGSAYVSGVTNSENFPTTAGALNRSPSRFGVGGFVTKLNAAGSALRYSTYLGNSGVDPLDEYPTSPNNEGGLGIAVDRAGSAYVTGKTESRTFPTTAGAYDRSYNRDDLNVFVTKLNAAGSALVYSTYLGTGFGLAIAVDRAGSAYVTGTTDARDFPTTAGALDASYLRGSRTGDAFVTKLNAAGSALVYSTYLGGSEIDRGEAIAVDGAGSAYVTGRTGSTSASSVKFPTTAKAFDRSVSGDSAFVTKIDIPQRCVVPSVVRMPLARASAKIRQAGCAVGSVRRERSKDVGLVIGQRPRAGTTGAQSLKVNLVVGRR